MARQPLLAITSWRAGALRASRVGRISHKEPNGSATSPLYSYQISVWPILVVVPRRWLLRDRRCWPYDRTTEPLLDLPSIPRFYPATPVCPGSHRQCSKSICHYGTPRRWGRHLNRRHALLTTTGTSRDANALLNRYTCMFVSMHMHVSMHTQVFIATK